MSQHSVKKGLKIFGKAGTDDVLSEMKKLHDHQVLEPKQVRDLTLIEIIAVLRYLMF
jgi:hypothetical protein